MKKKNYGGAYDIDPEMYFSKDDIDELLNAVNDLKHDFKVNAIFIDSANKFFIEYEDKHGNNYDLMSNVQVDLRKAKTCKELCERYAPIICNTIQSELDSIEKELEDEEYEDIMMDSF